MNILFQSERLSFRPWEPSDIDVLHEICSDPKVMQHFPATLTFGESQQLLERLIKHQDDHGFSYFAVMPSSNEKCIGFIGLMTQDYGEELGKFIDIGWRLSPNYWGQGLATEGALRVLEYGFGQLGLKEIFSHAPKINVPSVKVMQNIGMKYEFDFKHPQLKDYPLLETCVRYKMVKSDFEASY